MARKISVSTLEEIQSSCEQIALEQRKEYMYSKYEYCEKEYMEVTVYEIQEYEDGKILCSIQE